MTHIDVRPHEPTEPKNLFDERGSFESPLERHKRALPESHVPYTDKYFLRSGEILREEGINPFVRGQVMIRKGPGAVFGLDEAIAIIDRYSDFRKNGGRIFALEEGDHFGPKETLMIIEGRIQDIIELETMYLGVIARETTKHNDGVDHVDLEQVRENAQKVKALIGDRPLLYFGARHWGFEEDALIARAAFEGGATDASTDIGAELIGKQGMGTIPHVLENIYASIVGKENAVKEATAAFDRVISRDVPRVALIDYNNKEIDDSLATARALEGRLFAVRVDTCGENLAQGAYASREEVPSGNVLGPLYDSVSKEEGKYWFGNGVTISGVYALRKALDDAGFADVKLVLSSGFADARKVKAFVHAEELLGVRLFDSLGVGGLYSPCRESKMDIVAVAESLDKLDACLISKAGRGFNPNDRLKLQLAA